MFNIQSQKSSMNSYSSVWLFEVMNYIYWLLIISSVQLIAAALRHFLFELTAQRQTNRIRIRLFQAILQRVQQKSIFKRNSFDSIHLEYLLF